MTRRLAVFVLLAMFTGLAGATVVGTHHDLSTTGGSTTYRSNNVDQVCVFCHTPHQTTGVTTDPLWNHTTSATSSYGVYASPTLQAVPATFGGSANVVSALCMSCHDGTVGVGSLYRNPEVGVPSNSALMITGAALMGTDLSNDHPINFTYDSALVTSDGALNDPTVPPISNWLVGGTMQCSSCHDPHDDTNAPFLNASNVASALCTTCHIK